MLNLDDFSDEALARACTPVRLRATFPRAVAAQRADDPAMADYLVLTAPFVESLQLIAAAGELSAAVEILSGQGAYPGTDDGLPPFLSLHIRGAVFQSTFSWPVFAELRRLLRAHQHGDLTRSYQGRHVSLYVPESSDLGLVLPNLRLRLAPDTFTPARGLSADAAGAPGGGAAGRSRRAVRRSVIAAITQYCQIYPIVRSDRRGAIL
ncbi:hypothetical protein [Serratia bockelmannii]|uniref:hypothetical protein n=1 Tax=Serratia bockelmannii TaxID=2703793 RepID=UPI0011CACC78|nr:hypothetical protein [Serratia bockelmannii]TXE49609.1 hypothetical protein FOT55_12835 [Serratia bockelmannii]BEL92776.1 hypothetical protein SM14BL03_46840 [Serratia marcescens]